MDFRDTFEQRFIECAEKLDDAGGAARRLPLGYEEAQKQGVHGARDVASKLPVGIDLPAHEKVVVAYAELHPRDDEAVAGQRERGGLEKVDGLFLECEIEALQTALYAGQRLVFPIHGE